ncbi:putative signal peptide protein [Puccinia sorghi]|uniref:Putative signal peptide protein n=1 Tax=Puccinia sorghi TaxID=27349 RepID=A0A0L6UKA3_9BASI|nr:putative signal peptide protein [Puccinia sorghi]
MALLGHLVLRLLQLSMTSAEAYRQASMIQDLVSGCFLLRLEHSIGYECHT